MAFLDNSGDIILDAVLTDAGRKRLAEGNGSFRITKYAFGDDEINYGNYDTTSASGSAYYDLQILQTPVLEAFTNNTATMRSKLISLTNNNILYLPVMILNTINSDNQTNSGIGSGSFLVTTDQTTTTKFNDTDYGTQWLNGYTPTDTGRTVIRIDQGLNTNEISNAYKLDSELTENQYIVELDNRFGFVTDKVGEVKTSMSFVDDDSVASYYLSTDSYVFVTPALPGTGIDLDSADGALTGPRGTHLEFRIGSSTSLKTSTFLFEQLGGTFVATGITYYYIDTIVRVTGATTGYKIDIPVRFVKYKSG